MKHPIVCIVCVLLFMSSLATAQTGNPNLADPGSGCSVEQASSNQPFAYKAITGNTEEGWNSAGETAGATITLTYAPEIAVREVWILARPIFSHVITPYNLQYRYSYAPPRTITITFSDGTSRDVTLQRADDFQIIPLAETKRTSSVTITVRDVWQEEGTTGTGIGKVRVFAQPNSVTFTMRSMENYNAVDGKPVKRAMLTVVNPGATIEDAHISIAQRGKVLDDVALGTIGPRAVMGKEIWTFVPPADGDYDIALMSGEKAVAAPLTLPMTAFRKTYFDGGEVLVHSTNHNDLGWLGTQFETADYRSKEIILPALKIMESAPEFNYTMEAVAYLREFLERHPEKKEEIFRRTAERRFSWGAVYTLSLQEQVGAEKLVRQFYFGRRWIKENIPGADTRIYINADPPMLTWQLPQILKHAGVDYLIQARIPLGFYYWQGLDGTTVPVYGLRYGNSPRISPGANEEWLNLVYGREEYARSRNLPRTMIYDYNEDYLPPNGDFVPFVKKQNAMMSAFAAAWNTQHAADPSARVRPPVLSFTNPEDMLKGIFSAPGAHLQTLRGQWPNAWAFYDEPGNREALLQGRKAHNLLLSAEQLFSFLKATDPAIAYPKSSLDTAWQANLWPDHGWGGGKGSITDSIYHASYRRSYAGARSLMEQGMRLLGDRIARQDSRGMQVVVYNPMNWDRREPARASFPLPKDWRGFAVKDVRGAAVPFEVIGRTADTATVLLLADVPALGYATYRIERAAKTASAVTTLSGDSIDTPDFKVVFGSAGITEYTDKVKRRSYFRTDKFQAGEILQFTAPGNAWEEEALLKGIPLDLERSGTRPSTTVRFVETPLRWIRETETPLGNCVARYRYAVSKLTHDVDLELDLRGWNGTRAKEVRIAFPMNIERKVTAGLITVPASCVSTPDGTQRGLLGEYFRNPHLDGEPAFTRVDTVMAPYWDKASPGEGVPKDFFSVRWTGTLHVPETGDYTLGIITDDKGRLFFENELVIDNWNPYELNMMKTFSRRLEKGKDYRIRIDFADIVEYAGIRFQWRKDEDAADVKQTASISYEIPFGAVEFNKDEADFSVLPDNKESQYYPNLYGGYEQLAFREALNWVNVSTGSYKGYGCLFASDMTVHMFDDHTSQPVEYPVVQHVLLSTRKSLAWDPEYWFEQKGDHTFRMALMFHDGNWRMRYRDGIAFNNPLVAAVSSGRGDASRPALPASGKGFLRVEPSNIIITSVKESEDGTGTVVRFYEAEGDRCTMRLTGAAPIREAIRTDLLEYPAGQLPVEPDGSLVLQLKPWEIVTLVIKR